MRVTCQTDTVEETIPRIFLSFSVDYEEDRCLRHGTGSLEQCVLRVEDRLRWNVGKLYGLLKRVQGKTCNCTVFRKAVRGSCGVSTRTVFIEVVRHTFQKAF